MPHRCGCFERGVGSTSTRSIPSSTTWKRTRSELVNLASREPEKARRDALRPARADRSGRRPRQQIRRLRAGFRDPRISSSPWATWAGERLTPGGEGDRLVRRLGSRPHCEDRRGGDASPGSTVELRGKRFDLALSRDASPRSSRYPESDVVREHPPPGTRRRSGSWTSPWSSSEREGGARSRLTSGTYRKLATMPSTEAGTRGGSGRGHDRRHRAARRPATRASRLSLYLFFHTRKRYAEEDADAGGSAVRECPDSDLECEYLRLGAGDDFPRTRCATGRRPSPMANRALSLSDEGGPTLPGPGHPGGRPGRETGDLEACRRRPSEKAVDAWHASRRSCRPRQIADFEQHLAEIRGGPGRCARPEPFPELSPASGPEIRASRRASGRARVSLGHDQTRRNPKPRATWSRSSAPTGRRRDRHRTTGC